VSAHLRKVFAGRGGGAPWGGGSRQALETNGTELVLLGQSMSREENHTHPAASWSRGGWGEGRGYIRIKTWQKSRKHSEMAAREASKR